MKLLFMLFISISTFANVPICNDITFTSNPDLYCSCSVGTKSDKLQCDLYMVKKVIKPVKERIFDGIIILNDELHKELRKARERKAKREQDN